MARWAYVERRLRDYLGFVQTYTLDMLPGGGHTETDHRQVNHKRRRIRQENAIDLQVDQRCFRISNLQSAEGISEPCECHR